MVWRRAWRRLSTDRRASLFPSIVGWRVFRGRGARGAAWRSTDSAAPCRQLSIPQKRPLLENLASPANAPFFTFLSVFFVVDPTPKVMDKPCPFRAFQIQEALERGKEDVLSGSPGPKSRVWLRLTQVFGLTLKKNAPPWASLPSVGEFFQPFDVFPPAYPSDRTPFPAQFPAPWT